MLLDMQAWLDGELRMCQALDDFSRAQWLPLLRRGLAEGKIGDASDLLIAFLDSPYKQQVKSEVYTSLRNDAFRCDESSLSWLHYGSWPSDHALTVDEKVAVWQVLKSGYEAKPNDFWSAVAGMLRPPAQAGDPAEVQRIVKSISSHC
jgi:hypothetical protein